MTLDAASVNLSVVLALIINTTINTTTANHHPPPQHYHWRRWWKRLDQHHNNCHHPHPPPPQDDSDSVEDDCDEVDGTALYNCTARAFARAASRVIDGAALYTVSSAAACECDRREDELRLLSWILQSRRPRSSAQRLHSLVPTIIDGTTLTAVYFARESAGARAVVVVVVIDRA